MSNPIYDDELMPDMPAGEESNAQERMLRFISAEDGDRLDKELVTLLDDFSRVQVQALIREGQVSVNGRTVKASYKLEAGDEVLITLPEDEEAGEPQPEDIPLSIVFENEHVAIIDKPAGMVVHPAYGHHSGTLVNAVLARWPQTATFGPADRAGIVHRLDKDTSGVILIAKTALALADLREQFQARTVKKRYLALVEGNPENTEGVIDAPIGRDPNQRKRMAVTRDGRAAVSEFRVLELYQDNALVEVFPQTGRTHQIRVHLAFIGHPVVGDGVYGRRKQRVKMKRHFLHAESLTFRVPGADEVLTASAPLPLPLQNVLEKLPR